jgi:hypothetical protein
MNQATLYLIIECFCHLIIEEIVVNFSMLKSEVDCEPF